MFAFGSPLNRRWALGVLFLVFAPTPALAANAAGKLEVSFWSAVPFALLLASIALLPLLREHWWHVNRNKALLAAGLSLPVVIYLLAINERTQGESARQLTEELFEYSSFILMLLALYTVSGGILLTGDIPARPRTNTLFLAIGALLANVIGTTGASMVLIRPVLRINHARQHKRHVPIFFIFIVSNTGGLLTPLGDPPLFLGFLQGVDFFWTTCLWRQRLLVNGVLLAVFFVWDSLAYRREAPKALRHDLAVRHPLRLSGLGLNGPLMLGVLLTIVLHSSAMGREIGKALWLGDLTLHRPWSRSHGAAFDSDLLAVHAIVDPPRQ